MAAKSRKFSNEIMLQDQILFESRRLILYIIWVQIQVPIMKGVFGDQFPVYQNIQFSALGLSNEKTLKTKINLNYMHRFRPTAQWTRPVCGIEVIDVLKSSIF